MTCYNPENCHDRNPTWSEENPEGRWRVFGYDELISRDKVNQDIFWLRDESLEEPINLPDPDVLAAEIVEDLQAALEQFRGIYEELENENSEYWLSVWGNHKQASYLIINETVGVE